MTFSTHGFAALQGGGHHVQNNHQTRGHGHGHGHHGQSGETDGASFSFRAQFDGAMGGAMEGEGATEGHSHGKSAQSPAFQVALYFSYSGDSAGAAAEAFENFGQAVSQFVQGLLALTNETGETPALPPVEGEGGEEGGEVPGETPETGASAPADDGPPLALVDDETPALDGTSNGPSGGTGDETDGGIGGDADIVAPTADDVLLDALFDDGEDEEQEAA